MRLVSFELAGEPRLAVQRERELLDVNRLVAAMLAAGAPHGRAAATAATAAAVHAPADATEFLAAGEPAFARLRAAEAWLAGLDGDAAERVGAHLQLDAVRLLPPVPNPPKILCVARNYRAHAAETGNEAGETPNLFARFASTLVADGEPVQRPAVSDQLDWEGELAVVIGRGGRHIPRSEALAHVAGYSIFNDLSVRDFQTRVAQYTAGKNFDASGPFGPALVTRDEIPDPQALHLEVDVNGEVVQSASTAEMLFSVAELIEHVSEWATLQPGDVIATGTPAGVGHARKPPRFLVPGDVVSVRIERLGELRNPVVQEPDPGAGPRASIAGGRV